MNIPRPHRRAARPGRQAFWALGLALSLVSAGFVDAVDLVVDEAQRLDPLIEIPDETVTFSTRLLPLWQQALDRDEAEPRRLAIDTITLATSRGMKGLEGTAPRLRKILADDSDPHLRRAAAGALVALDQTAAAADLAAASDRDGLLVARLVEPALARWDHAPRRDEWLDRLADRSTSPGLLLLAIDALGAVREPRAADPLAAIVADRDAPPERRLAAAGALGRIRTDGLLDSARSLAVAPSDAGPDSLGKLMSVALLEGHTGPDVEELLAGLAVDPEPAVATAALARLDSVAESRALEIARASLAVPDAGQRHLAARLAARPGDADCIARIGPLLGDRNPALRRWVAGTLADLGADATLRQPVLDEGLAALAGDQWRALEQGALLLGHLDHEPSADRFRELLDHDRNEVGVAAAWALRKIQVESTLAPLLAYATALRGRLQEQLPPELIGRLGQQAQQLHQLFGIMRYRGAEPLLREYVPKAQIDIRARSGAVWALGLLHEDEPDCDLAPAFAERLADVSSLPPESSVVRWMAAVGLGRFKAASQIDTLRAFAKRDTMFAQTGVASYWAIWRITGEPIPPKPVDAKKLGGWFLEPP